MRRITAHDAKLVILTGIVAGCLFHAGNAKADVVDTPTQPVWGAAWCPGGAVWTADELSECDGQDYPDGSYWELQRLYSGKIHRQCRQHGKDEFGFPWAALGGCGYLT